MPVRGWINLESAKKWNKHTGRNIILKIKCNIAYPLPDHKPMFHSYWTPENIYFWDIVEFNKTPVKPLLYMGDK